MTGCIWKNRRKLQNLCKKYFKKTRGSIVNIAGKPKTIVQSCFPKNALLHREYCWKSMKPSREEGDKMRESISLSVSLSDVGHQSDKSVCQTSVISLTGCRGTGFQHPEQIQRGSRAGASQSLGRGASATPKVLKVWNCRQK